MINTGPTVEWLIIECLQKIDQCQLYKKLGASSLFQYAVQILGFSESLAYSFIAVARKAQEITALGSALREQHLSVAKTQRMVSVLSRENAEELISFARSHSTRELDQEVSRLNTTANKSEKHVQLKLMVTPQVLEKLKQVQALEAQKGRNSTNFEVTLEAALDCYLKHHDPIAKAERAVQRSPREPRLCARKVHGRAPLKANERHAVHLRDRGRCTHENAQGQRCSNERYLAIHHIKPVSCGGGNEPENLTTLCWYHHDLVHQMPLLPLKIGASPNSSPQSF